MDTIKENFAAMRQSMQLPDSFDATIKAVYVPLAAKIHGRHEGRPLLVSINGAQGSGKSTLVKFVHAILEREYQYKVASMSLDDFYLTLAGRKQLAEYIHPLLITRGVPGTHDVELLESVLTSLLQGETCDIPSFDKALDDRVDNSAWKTVNGQVDIILFEGWCNNSPVQKPEELKEPVNELEAKEDPQGVWREYVNQNLALYHEKVFRLSNLNIMLKAPAFDCVYQWRKLQEDKLRATIASGPSNANKSKVMNAEQLRRFIQHYERITRYSIQHLPARSDIVLPINADQSITGIEVHA